MSESCDGYFDVHRHEIRKARKLRECSACERAIRPGDYYAYVFTVFDGEADTTERCGACERTWQHLKTKCDEYNRTRGRRTGERLYPYEDLGCGKAYEEEWGDVPDDIAALPLLSDDERGALLRPVKP
jgi:hypothetical protein